MVMSISPRLLLIRLLLFLALSCSAVTLAATRNAYQDRIWKVGDRIEVEWKGDWYQAQVIEVKANQYKVHYDGYASSWDEWIDKTRIRLAGVRIDSPSNSSQSPTAVSPFDQVVALLTQSQQKLASRQIDEAIS